MRASRDGHSVTVQELAGASVIPGKGLPERGMIRSDRGAADAVRVDELR